MWQQVDDRRPRTASKPVKLQRPGSGRRVQSLRKGRGRQHPADVRISREATPQESVKLCTGHH